MDVQNKSDDTRAQDTKRMEFITFLWVSADGRLRTDIEVAVYSADGLTRHVFAGSLETRELFQFDRVEHYIAPDSLGSGGPWWGKKFFGQKAPPAATRKLASRWAQERVNEARAQGNLLGLGLDVAARERNDTEAWAEARVRYLMSADPETVRRHSGSLISAIGSATQEAEESHERWSRMLTLNHNIRALGHEFWARERVDLDGSSRTDLEPQGARLFGDAR
jgi:hypothetical protein